jgi:hypothetical protein
MEWMDLDRKGKLIKEGLLVTATEEPVITGEATATTFAQVPPLRLKEAYPEARLILSLRHPVDRAYSHYSMLKRFVEEGRRVPIELTDFQQDFLTDIKRWRKGEPSYFAGISYYAERLATWQEVFYEKQLYILTAEDLGNPEKARTILQDICAFLSVQPYEFDDVVNAKVNKDIRANLDPDVRKECFEYYRDDIAMLERITGRTFNWHP